MLGTDRLSAMNWISTPITDELVRGAAELERTEHGLLPHRLPAWARAQCADGQLAMAESQPSGVRLVLRTRATVIELDTVRTRISYVGAPAGRDGIYDLLVDGVLRDQTSVSGGNVVVMDMTTGAAQQRPGPVGTIRFAGLSDEDKTVEIWLPYNEITELVALRADAMIEVAPPDGRPVWLHHGSSISHGSAAASSTSTWPAVAAARGGVELVNLGLAGSALLDPFTARTLRDTPADLISVKLGINVVNHDLMRLRAFGPAVHGFLDTIREGHPTTPLLVVSPILCPIHEETPGPTAPDLDGIELGMIRFVAMGGSAEYGAGKLTLMMIRAELAQIVAQRCIDDPHLRYLDGRELYGAADTQELPLPDQLHPDAAAHVLMGERFAALALGPAGLMSR